MEQDYYDVEPFKHIMALVISVHQYDTNLALFITVIAPKLMDPKLVPIYASEYMWLLFHIYFLLLVKN